ncbi:unnamed protein product [Rhizoctonia solani]|uniref:Uncharacterized protein n=1 Tax=Rhizoctonia solani TaxID=456999 RepID=A0A8H3AE93_9AGAM|nr:unnamed protein product [Rhizoctonia solani]
MTTVTKFNIWPTTLETPGHKFSPYVILNETGSGFAIGAIGGGIWHGIKGARNAPRGLRLQGAIHGIKSRSPAVAGYRQKVDIWNGVFSGAGAGGCLAARGNFALAARNPTNLNAYIYQVSSNASMSYLKGPWLRPIDLNHHQPFYQSHKPLYPEVFVQVYDIICEALFLKQRG